MKINFINKLSPNTNIFVILDEKTNLNLLLKKIIDIDSRYNKIISEISKKATDSNLTVVNKNNYCQIYILYFKHKDINLDIIRDIGYKICNISRLNSFKETNILNSLSDVEIYACLEGLMLSNYNFNKYKTKKFANHTGDKNNKVDVDNKVNKNKNILLKKYVLNINVLSPSKNISKKSKDKINALPHIINAVFLARDLTNEPANIMNPETFPKIVLDTINANKLNIKSTLYNSKELARMNMNLLVSVGKSNKKESSSKLLVLEYKPSSMKTESKKPFILLGKGVTYDTGGLNLKTSESALEEGKTDMAGAATIIAFLTGYVKLNGNKHIIAYIPIAENNLDSSTSKVGDVIKSHKGFNVEISDTDAEGRLMMADCLSLITNNYPQSQIINIATLTGQQESMSCKMFSTIMGQNNSKVSSRLISIGENIGEHLVEIPIPEYYEDKIKSDIADIKNYSGKCSADMILAGMFLKQFIKKNTNWTHIDIGGTAFHMEDINKMFKGQSSGICVRLLFDFFMNNN